MGEIQGLKIWGARLSTWRLPDQLDIPAAARYGTHVYTGVVHFWPLLGNRWARGICRPVKVGLGRRGCFVQWRRSASPTQARWF
jgi:hypothetical protein